MKLPPLRDDESFDHAPWMDDGEIAGVELRLRKRHVSLIRILPIEQVYYNKADAIRPVIVEMLIELRVLLQDD